MNSQIIIWMLLFHISKHCRKSTKNIESSFYRGKLNVPIFLVLIIIIIPNDKIEDAVKVISLINAKFIYSDFLIFLKTWRANFKIALRTMSRGY